MLQKASISDKEEIAALYQAVKNVAKARGNSTWGEHYPTLDILEGDLAEETLYVLRREGLIVAAATLHPRDPEMEALTMPWEGHKPCYVSRLCVHPECQNQHLAETVMGMACDTLKNLGHDSLRLCCNFANPAAQRLYTRMGYRCVGEDVVDGAMHYLFEKMLDPIS